MLGTNIREYRKKQKLTMKELAERTGLSHRIYFPGGTGGDRTVAVISAENRRRI